MESSEEHKAALAELMLAAQALEQLKRKVIELSRKEMRLRPICPKCKSRAGTGTERVLGCGGDYEDWPCSECCREEYLRACRG